MPLALFRCDASPTIGAGHVSRCLALAEALTETGWRVRFVVGPETVAIMPDIAAYEPHVLSSVEHDIPAMHREAGVGADLIVIDHYARDVAFERACRPFTRTILALDDNTGRDHDCDLLLDAAGQGPEQYRGRVPARARVLTGPGYALVRKSFIAARPAALGRRDGGPVCDILVSCGATDPLNATAAALDAVADLPSNIAVTAVLSSKAPHVGTVRGKLRPGAKLVSDTGNMAELMSRADLAIGAPGSTSYERAVLGLPSIIVTVAENQHGIASMTVGAGAALDAGRLDSGLAGRLHAMAARLLENSELRVRMARAAAALIDGRGAARICEAVS
jgi:UDP-2,4-diacetamido-2,4,6-trideoxy-beta-L-altropyranose hydrolase